MTKMTEMTRVGKHKIESSSHSPTTSGSDDNYSDMRRLIAWSNFQSHWQVNIFLSACSMLLFSVQYSILKSAEQPSETTAADTLATAIGASVPFIIIPRLRVANNQLSRWIPSWNHEIVHQLHDYSAVQAILLSMVHGGLHVYNEEFSSESHVDDSIDDHDDSPYYRKLSTGLIMLGIATSIAIAGYFRNRFPSHRSFIYSHAAGALGVLMLYMLHNPHLNPATISGLPSFFVAVSVFALFVDRLYEKLNFRHKAVVSEQSSILSENLIMLKLARPDGFHYSPGDTVDICAKNIGFEWHPFSVANVRLDEEYLQLIISQQGRWTQKLRKGFDRLVKTEVELRGPYYSVMQKATSTNEFNFMSTGVGLNPLFAMLNENPNCKEAHIVSRDSELLLLLIGLLSQIKASGDNQVLTNLFLYFTGDQNNLSDLASAISNAQSTNMLKLASSDNRSINEEDVHGETERVSCRYKLFFHSRRPDLNKITKNLRGETLFFSGHPKVGRELSKACRSNNVHLISEPRLHSR